MYIKNYNTKRQGNLLNKYEGVVGCIRSIRCAFRHTGRMAVCSAKEYSNEYLLNLHA